MFMYNPYALLKIKETADEKEIRIALKKQIENYCSGFGDSISDRNNLKEIFVNAAKDLLDPIKRREIDENLFKNRSERRLQIYSKKKEQENEDVNQDDAVFENEYSFDDMRDVKKIYICTYNNNESIGLFKKIDWACDEFPYDLTTGCAFIGIDSDYVGFKTYLFRSQLRNRFDHEGKILEIDGKNYISNCEISNSISFADMRLKLYREGKIDSYEVGKASSKDMLDILCLAADYYNIGNDDLKKDGMKRKISKY